MAPVPLAKLPFDIICLVVERLDPESAIEFSATFSTAAQAVRDVGWQSYREINVTSRNALRALELLLRRENSNGAWLRHARKPLHGGIDAARVFFEAYYEESNKDNLVNDHSLLFDFPLCVQLLSLQPGVVTGTLYNIGRAFSGRNDATRALEYFDRALGGSDCDGMSANILIAIGDLFMSEEQQDCARALKSYSRALSFREELLGPDNELTMEVVQNMAGALHVLGDNTRALQLSSRTLAFREATLGPDHPLTGDTLYFMANVIREQGDSARALELYIRALAVEESFSPEPDVADTLLIMAHLFEEQGDITRAVEHSERALAAYEHEQSCIHDPDDFPLSMLLIKLSSLVLIQEDYPRGFEYAERARALFETSDGPDYAYAGAALHNMAAACRGLRDFTRALEYGKRALTIREKAHGPNSPQAGETLSLIGIVHQDQGDFTGGLECFERALPSCTLAEKPSANDPAQAEMLYKIGCAFLDCEDYPRAHEHLGRALTLTEACLSPDHPRTGEILGRLGEVLLAQKDYSGALQYLQRALTISEFHKGSDTASTGVILKHMAESYSAKSDYAPAVAHYQRCLPIQEKLLGANHPAIANTVGSLGAVLLAQGDHTRAGGYLERALSIQESSSETHPADTKLTLELLSFVSMTRGDQMRGLQYFMRAQCFYASLALALFPIYVLYKRNQKKCQRRFLLFSSGTFSHLRFLRVWIFLINFVSFIPECVGV